MAGSCPSRRWWRSTGRTACSPWWPRWAWGRQPALWLAGLLLLQLLTGLSNVVLRWPLLGALMHSAGAAAMVGVLVAVIARRRFSVSAGA
jgi:heme A synthase